MPSIKQLQIAEQVKRHFSLLLQKEGAYVYGAEALVTVTNVIMSPDLSIAKVYLSVFNTENKQGVLLNMEEEAGHLRTSLGRRVRSHMRRIPELQFFLDETLDEMYRVDDLLNRLEEEGQMGNPEEEE